MIPLIIWHNGIPIEESINQVEKKVTALSEEGLRTFYVVLRENSFDLCGSEVIDSNHSKQEVWAYHTGWQNGNESIICALRKSPWWEILLIRYDQGGHYYFMPETRAMNFFKKEVKP